jgi:hypothetical protein
VVGDVRRRVLIVAAVGRAGHHRWEVARLAVRARIAELIEPHRVDERRAVLVAECLEGVLGIVGPVHVPAEEHHAALAVAPLNGTGGGPERRVDPLPVVGGVVLLALDVRPDRDGRPLEVAAVDRAVDRRDGPVVARPDPVAAGGTLLEQLAVAGRHQVVEPPLAELVSHRREDVRPPGLELVGVQLRGRAPDGDRARLAVGVGVVQHHPLAPVVLDAGDVVRRHLDRVALAVDEPVRREVGVPDDHRVAAAVGERHWGPVLRGHRRHDDLDGVARLDAPELPERGVVVRPHRRVGEHLVHRRADNGDDVQRLRGGRPLVPGRQPQERPRVQQRPAQQRAPHERHQHHHDDVLDGQLYH